MEEEKNTGDTHAVGDSKEGGHHTESTDISLPAIENSGTPEKKSFWENFKKPNFLGICILISALIISGTIVYTARDKNTGPKVADAKTIAKLEKMVLPPGGIELPVRWNDLGKQLADSGTIDLKKFEELYVQRGGMDETAKKLLYESENGRIVINKDNADELLNLLWALGLANKNVILDKGPINDKKYGGDPSKFASTGGWPLAKGNVMNHFSRHAMIPLTLEQQALVERTSQNIFRPCCGNSTFFPDCNHGMAMLALLELMASQGVSEGDMYRAALAANSYWFPDTYITIAQYLKTKGIDWDEIKAKELLSANYSSASGFQKIKSQVVPAEPKSGNGGCGA